MAADEMVKKTIRLPKSLVKQAEHYAVDAEKDFQEIVAEALRLFLGKKGSR